MSGAIDGRRFVREAIAIALADDEDRGGGRTVLAAPMPGLFRDAPREGALLAAGTTCGELEVLGSRYRLIVPAGAHGVVVAAPEVVGGGRRAARRPVAYREALVVLDPAALGGAASASATRGEARAASGALAFRAPMSGRYYARPSPDAEPLVSLGDVIEAGRTVAILEVMKTFNRVQYGGAGLPERAKVVAIVPKDGDDVNAGDPLLELAPA